MNNQENLLDNLCLTARVRRKELKTRIIIAVFGACMLWYAIGFVFSLIWLPLVLISQAFDFWAWSVLKRDLPDGLSTHRYRLLLFASLQASAVYSLIAVFLWCFGDTSARVFAYLWLAGSILHVTLHMHHDRGAYLAGVAAHTVYFFGIPLLGLIGNHGMPRADAIMILIAVALYSGHLVTAFVTTRRFSRELTTARQQAEERQIEAEKANKAKSDFIGSMSHEIRTPLNGVLGMAESLKQERLSQSASEKVEILHDSSRVLLRLLNDILDLSKIEAGCVDLETRTVNLEKIAVQVGRSHQHIADKKGVTLSITFEDGIELLRKADELRLMQILNNLLSNAIKFTEKGEVVIHQESDPESGDLLIRVRDTGIGMTPEQLTMVMEPFKQADDTITRRYGGTGLGLTIVNGLVMAMGGSLSLTSVLDEGTEFVVRLPLLVSQSDESFGVIDQNNTQADLFSGIRVLVADDNQVNRMVIETYLRTLQVTSYLVEDGEAAIDAVSKHDFDLVLMDISMPGMGGIQATSKIQQVCADRGTVSPPVIAVTGHVLSHETDQYFVDGFSGFLPKPISLSDLRQTLRDQTRSMQEDASRISA